MNINLWLAPVAPLSAALLADLDDADRSQAARIAHPQRRASFVSAHALLRRVLGDRVGLAPAAVPIDRSCRVCGGDDHGKPFVVGVDPPTVFSLSATPDLVALAVAGSGQLGLDIEDARAGRTWVRREAVLKATGHGLAIDPELVVVTGDRPRVLGWPLRELHDFHLLDLDPAPSIVGCVAWRGASEEPPTLSIWNWMW